MNCSDIKVPNGIVFPTKNKDFDVFEGFINPPKGYGAISFYWWVGDKLTKERLSWQLEKLKGQKISGLQINYCHSDKGGNIYGLTYKSDPDLFSDEWWELFCWFVQEAKKQNISVSLSDYTLGTAGQGYFTDEILSKYPSICGATLTCEERDSNNGDTFEYIIDETVLSIISYKKEDALINLKEAINLIDFAINGKIKYNNLSENQTVYIIKYKIVEQSLDPMNSISGEKVIETFFERFESKNPEECGVGLNFFFSDELTFGVSGNLWNKSFAKEFLERKGYDIIPYVLGIFKDIGDITPKIRMDYYDIIVTLEEQNYFNPIFQWHQKRGMIYGCDHGGRGKDVVEFGDYFRTQKYNQGPGNDQPCLESDIIKNKVSSSIAHLYERPRTWLEGFYGSGWGTSSKQLTDAIFRNFAMGHNLLALHGLYYTTYGGYWEWAPPCNHFRMPYWQHMDKLLTCTERLSYLLSQGVHCCDVAVMYPVAPMESGMDGENSVRVAFEVGELLYTNAIDFDYMDFESLDKAEIVGNELKVAEESYKVLILPSMKAMRYSNILKLKEFYLDGGIIISIGELPQASEKSGKNDVELNNIINEIFNRNENKKTFKVINSKQAFDVIANNITRDFECITNTNKQPYILHRKIGNRDIYMVYGTSKNSECFFRAKGNVELWDPWTTEVYSLSEITHHNNGVSVVMPLNESEIQIISIGQKTEGAKPFKKLTISKEIPVEGDWEFELIPTMDNQWGDYSLPQYDGFIGAEISQLECYFVNNIKQKVTIPYGASFLKLEPVNQQCDINSVEYALINYNWDIKSPNISVNNNIYDLSLYEFSYRYGLLGDPGHQGYHGLKGKISDEFLCFGKKTNTLTSTEYTEEISKGLYYFITNIYVEKDELAKVIIGSVCPEKIWVNGKLICISDLVKFKSGNNSIVFCFNSPGRTYLLFEKINSDNSFVQTYPLSMKWYNNPNIYKFNLYPSSQDNQANYKFISPPALKKLKIIAHGKINVFVNDNICESKKLGSHPSGASIYETVINNTIDKCSEVKIIANQINTYFTGGFFEEPIKLQCGVGRISLGDWSCIDSLYSYSGGARYRKHINISPEEYLDKRVVLNLGDVASSAEIIVNGKLIAVKLCPDWRVDITDYLINGENLIDIIVYNTLANHYTTKPTRYNGPTISGLLGPVTLEICM